MKKILFIIGLVLITMTIAGCSSNGPSEGAIQTAIAQTAEAESPESDSLAEVPASSEEEAVPTNTAISTDLLEPTTTTAPTETAVPTDTPIPTATVEPTETPTETPMPTPTPLPIGQSRAQPYGPGEIVDGQSWQVQVLETLRGEEAWQQLVAANQFNDPPPEGMEYLLVKVHAKNISTGAEAIHISNSDFDITGDNKVLYNNAYAVEPDPELDAELFSGGETEGWISFLVGEGEGNLMLILDEVFSFDESERRFIALDEGASVTVDQALYDVGATSLGTTRSEPADIGESVATDEFEVTVQEIMRGDDVYNMLMAENQFNEPPDEGMTYIAAKVLARRIGTGDRALEISDSNFDLVGDQNILYRLPSVVVPDELDFYLFPGGETEGWVVAQAEIGEGNLMLAYEPLFSFTDEDLRFLALDENASIIVPEELNSISENELGITRTEPAALGETVNTGNFEFTVTDVIRGNEAFAMAQQANQFNDPPDEGMEYVAVKIRVHRIDPNDDSVDVSGSAFELSGDNGVIYDNPSVVEPDPQLDVRLYPDGEYEGWAVYQAAEGEGGLVLIYNPLFSGDNRYLALE